MRKQSIAVGVVAALAGAAGSVSAQPVNNDCASAIDVSFGGQFAGTLTGATRDGTAPCGVSALSADVWYHFTARAAGTLAVSTCGTNDLGGVDAGIDTVVSLHAACGVAPFACNDDSAACGAADQPIQRDSYVEGALTAGQSVWIRVSNYLDGPRGPFVLNVGFTPANDGCGAAQDVSAGGVFAGSLRGAASSTTGNCGGSDDNPDVWFRYTQGSCPGSATFRTCGSAAEWGIDTVLSVYEGCGGWMMACSDDSPDCGWTLDSSATVNLFAGQTVLVRASRYYRTLGEDFTLEVSGGLGTNDACWNAVMIGEGMYTVCTTGASTDGPAEPGCGFCCGDSQVGSDMWYRYVPSSSGLVTVDFCGSPAPTFDTKVAVYHGNCPTAPGAVLACNDDYCGTLSRLQFWAAGAEEYLIRVGGYQGAQGSALMGVFLSPCLADFNGDGFLDFFDYDEYVLCFETGVCPAGRTADFNGDGFADFFDYDDFVGAFESGC